MQVRPLLLGACFALLTGFAHSPSLANEVVRVGVLQPLTGDCALWGLPATRGAELWAKKINDAGGLKAGDGKTYNVEIKAYDNNCYSAGDELKAARRAVLDDGIHYLMQTYTPAARRAIAPLTNERDVLVMSYGAGFLSKEFPYLLGGITGSPMANMLVISHVLEKHPDAKRIAIITLDTSFGQAASAYTRAGLATFKDKVKIVYDSSYDGSAASDVLGLMTPVIAAQPDVIVEVGQTPTGQATLLAAADQLGYQGLFVSESWGVTQIKQQGLLEKMAGRLFSASGVDGAEPTFSPELHRMYEEYVAQYGAGEWNNWASGTYAALAVLEVGWRAAPSMDAKTVREALEKMEVVDHPLFGASKWSGEEIFGVKKHLLTPLPIYGIAADGSTVLDGVVNAADWWDKNKAVALPQLKAGNQVFVK